MQIESQFTVNAPVDRVWQHLLDVERVAPCAPGAELTEVVDDRTWKGKVAVKIGPVSLSFNGTVTIQERDDAAHRVVLKAQGMEQRGKGAATAVMTGRLEGSAEGTRVTMLTDLTITGAVAQYGRGMILDISKRMTREFAQCLETNMQAAGPAPVVEADDRAEAGPTAPAEPSAETAAEPRAEARARRPASPEPRPTAARPVRGFRLGLWALWRAVVRFFRRLFGGRQA